MLALPFELWTRKMETGLFMSTPMVTYATRPSFASTLFPASIGKEEVEFLDFVKEGDIVSFGSYYKYSTQYYLRYALKNGNALRIDYFWTYESYNAQNPIKTGEHSIMISTFFKI